MTEPTRRELDMATLIKQLAHKLPTDDSTRKRAMEYLRREGLLGSPLRALPATNWKPIKAAPKIEGNRILAWCRAAESQPGAAELYWTGTDWWWVHEHPYANACPCPTHYIDAPQAP